MIGKERVASSSIIVDFVVWCHHQNRGKAEKSESAAQSFQRWEGKGNVQIKKEEAKKKKKEKQHASFYNFSRTQSSVAASVY